MTRAIMTENPTQSFTFAPIPNWILKRKEISHGGKLVYGQLYQYSRMGSSPSYPSRERLSDDLGMSISAVDRFIKELSSLNLIRVIRNGKSLNNSYEFPLHIWMKDARVYDSSKVTTSDSSKVTTPYKDYKISRKYNIIQSDKDFEKEDIPPPGSDFQKEFEEWWSIYPRRQNRGKALSAFLEARKHANLETLILKAKSYARRREREVSMAKGMDYNSNQDLYTLGAHTWLMNRGWEDYYGRDEVIKSKTPSIPQQTRKDEKPVQEKRLTPEESDIFFSEIKKQLKAA